MFDFLSEDKKRVLVDYPFVKSFTDGKINLDTFVTDLSAFSDELKSKGFSKSEIGQIQFAAKYDLNRAAKETGLDFLKKIPKGVYSTHFNHNLNDGDTLKFEKDTEDSLAHIHSDPRGFIQTPREFFQRWLNGRIDKTPNLGPCKGFELQLPILVDNYGIKRVEGLVIASDLAYSSQWAKKAVFVINNVKSQKVLIYHELEEGDLKRAPLAEKPLVHTNINITPQIRDLKTALSSKSGTIQTWEPQQYPFTSRNPGKSGDFTWTLINITPDEVYTALKEIGFKW